VVTTVAVIPARYASTRFPGKPLAQDTGKYLIQHVCERVWAARRVDRVIVATDDERIVAGVESFGGEARMTRADHLSGTNRVAEVAFSLHLGADDVVLNVQGDEPELDPATLDRLVELLERDPACRIATPAAAFRDDGPVSGPGSPADPNCVKVVVAADGRALYFSRSLIPYPRDTGGIIDRPSRWLLHLGVYAFRADVLQQFTHDTGIESSGLERVESLEQLQWLARGFPIRIVTVVHSHAGIDTPEDYAAFVRRASSTRSTRFGDSGAGGNADRTMGTS
jgi:3-deoxy-manno-octulosonate cytidylyltransferase (CMP-KDO synthetase)